MISRSRRKTRNIWNNLNTLVTVVLVLITTRVDAFEKSKMAPRGMVVTPHHLATQSALDILREGGTAMEATIAAAATISVVYPHMSTIGGDSVWLIVPPSGDPIVIAANGGAGSKANLDFYKGLSHIPSRGPKAANTVAGAIGGWQEALNYVTENGYEAKALSRLLADAITYAEEGFPVSTSLELELKNVRRESLYYEFERTFFPEKRILKLGERLTQKTLANTLKQLARDGLNSFYSGELAKLIAEDFAELGSPITISDLENYRPLRTIPLQLNHTKAKLYNTPPPTQGVISLAILGMLDYLGIEGRSEGEFINAAVEATKQAFSLRDRHITDPLHMTINCQDLLSTDNIKDMAKTMNFANGKGKGDGDTVWIGVMDNKGYSVSFLQSIARTWGSGIVLPKTGILWNNRGNAFTLDSDNLLSLVPGKKPFLTLNPAAAKFHDGRVMIYGSRGGDGQPQTQTAIFHRYAVQGLPLQTSISSPRWVYGPVYGTPNDSLWLEGRHSNSTGYYLKNKGFSVFLMRDYDENAGQSGALVRHLNGMIEGAADPRSDGGAAGF